MPHQYVIDKYGELYREQFGAPYPFGGEKDTSAVERLLKTSKLAPDDILDCATWAWSAANRDVFTKRQATSLAGLASVIQQVFADRAAHGKGKAGRFPLYTPPASNQRVNDTLKKAKANLERLLAEQRRKENDERNETSQ